MSLFSLRTRLVAVAVALVAFAVVATGVATYVALHGFLYARLDDQLDQAARGPTPVCLQSNRAGGLPRPGAYVAKLTDAGAPIRVRCTDGQPIGTLLDLPAGDGLRLAQAPGSTLTVRSADSVEFHAVAVPAGPFDPLGVGWTVVALPTGDVADTLSRLVGLELVIGTAAVVGTGVLGTAGVRLGMRPLYRVTRTARTVAAELGPDGRGLSNRVPGADPRTEVGQLADAVNTMLGAVEREYSARYESEQRMRRFLADASHELRTPLTSLRGYAELVRLRGGLDADASDSLRRIEAEGTRMGGLVDDLLTLARSDRGALPEREPVDVAEMVSDAVAGVRAAHPGRPVEVTGAGPLPVLGDRDQLLQVLTNVLTNAAVHATAPAPIRVTAGREGAEVVVRVADGGPGLPPEQAVRVFDRFWRADAARTRVRGGSGLGLSIVQALVANHGGRVAFDSSVAGGTTVTVRLPAVPARAAARPSGSTAAPPVRAS